MQRATRRFVILGASNVANSFPLIVELLRAARRDPVDILAAIGHGRSYGQDSWVMGRKISGIFPCALWRDLRQRAALPTAALLTDVGNDILYGISPQLIHDWVTKCVDELQSTDARIAITQLPIASLERLGERRFRFFRGLFFPRCRLTLAAALQVALETNARLIELGEMRKVSVIPVSGEWYGFDPIHMRRTVRPAAWRELLSYLDVQEVGDVTLRTGAWQRAYTSILPRDEYWLFGCARRAVQPSGHTIDGSTISLY